MPHTLPPKLNHALSHTDFVAGSDEAGSGAWAGPLFVAVACVPASWVPPAGLTDSKALTEAKREVLYDQLTRDPLVYLRHQEVSSFTIDCRGIANCNLLAHSTLHKVCRDRYLPLVPATVHVADGSLDLEPWIHSVPKADALVAAVSAASVVAKVLRDRAMVELAKQYPQYGFEGHKGYGTKAHQLALETYGPCAAHRRSFAPVKNLTLTVGASMPTATPEQIAAHLNHTLDGIEAHPGMYGSTPETVEVAALTALETLYFLRNPSSPPRALLTLWTRFLRTSYPNQPGSTPFLFQINQGQPIPQALESLQTHLHQFRCTPWPTT